MSKIASQITNLTIVYSTVYSDPDQTKHQSSASLAFVRGIHRERWIPRTKGQWRGKCFHLMTSSCFPNQWHRIRPSWVHESSLRCMDFRMINMYRFRLSLANQPIFFARTLGKLKGKITYIYPEPFMTAADSLKKVTTSHLWTRLIFLFNVIPLMAAERLKECRILDNWNACQVCTLECVLNKVISPRYLLCNIWGCEFSSSLILLRWLWE